MNDAGKDASAGKAAAPADGATRQRMSPGTRIVIEITLNAAIWMAWIIILGSGEENGIGYFHQPRHDLWLPLIHGALWNAVTFLGNAFWLMPRYLKPLRYGTYLSGLLVLVASVLLLKTLGEELLILIAYPDLADVPIHLLALENLYILPVMIVLSASYRFARDAFKGAHREPHAAGTGKAGEVWIKSGTRRERLPIDDILCVKACDNYVVFELRERKLMALMSMNKALEALPAERFLRIHRSHIVALDKLESVLADAVVVNGEHLPIGRTYRKSVQRRLARLASTSATESL